MADGATGAERLRSMSATPPLPEYLRQVWDRRAFTWSLGTGSLRAEHLDTILGNAWHVLNPALLMLVYYIIFGVLLGGRAGAGGNFIGFLAVGMFTFTFVQRTVMSCGSSIHNNLGLIRSLQFPRAILPIATILREITGYGFAFAVMLAVLLATGEFPTPSWVLAPLVIALLTLFNAGVGLVVARLTDSVRDIGNVIPFVFRLLFYLSGIIFSIDFFVTDEALADIGVPLSAETVKQLFILDPYFTYIDLLRGLLMNEYDTLFPFASWVYCLVTAPVMFVVGLAYFRGGEKRYGRG